MRVWRHLEKRYGLTKEAFLQLYESQAGGCAICGAPHALCVDHCHSTGVVRGLLCDSCNNGLGRFRDNPDSLRKAAEYLEKATNETQGVPLEND